MIFARALLGFVIASLPLVAVLIAYEVVILPSAASRGIGAAYYPGLGPSSLQSGTIQTFEMLASMGVAMQTAVGTLFNPNLPLAFAYVITLTPGLIGGYLMARDEALAPGARVGAALLTGIFGIFLMAFAGVLMLAPVMLLAFLLPAFMQMGAVNLLLLPGLLVALLAVVVYVRVTNAGRRWAGFIFLDKEDSGRDELRVRPPLSQSLLWFLALVVSTLSLFALPLEGASLPLAVFAVTAVTSSAATTLRVAPGRGERMATAGILGVATAAVLIAVTAATLGKADEDAAEAAARAAARREQELENARRQAVFEAPTITVELPSADYSPEVTLDVTANGELEYASISSAKRRLTPDAELTISHGSLNLELPESLTTLTGKAWPPGETLEALGKASYSEELTPKFRNEDGLILCFDDTCFLTTGAPPVFWSSLTIRVDGPGFDRVLRDGRRIPLSQWGPEMLGKVRAALNQLTIVEAKR